MKVTFLFKNPYPKTYVCNVDTYSAPTNVFLIQVSTYLFHGKTSNQPMHAIALLTADTSESTGVIDYVNDHNVFHNMMVYSGFSQLVPLIGSLLVALLVYKTRSLRKQSTGNK